MEMDFWQIMGLSAIITICGGIVFGIIKDIIECLKYSTGKKRKNIYKVLYEKSKRRW